MPEKTYVRISWWKALIGFVVFELLATVLEQGSTLGSLASIGGLFFLVLFFVALFKRKSKKEEPKITA